MTDAVLRHLTRPLLRRRQSPANDFRLANVLAELEKRAGAERKVPELASAQRLKRAAASRVPGDINQAGSLIEFATALYESRRVSLQAYVFIVSSTVEDVHEFWLMDKQYPELEEASNAIRSLEEQQGLSEDEYWPSRGIPPENKKLLSNWSRLERARFLRALESLEGGIVYKLYVDHPEEHERLRERGRRSFFAKKDVKGALLDIVVRYENEARTAAQYGAYTAAVTMMGAALEGLLLLRCLRSLNKSEKTAHALPSKKRPRNCGAPLTWTLDTLISVCTNANWMPEIETESTVIRTTSLSHLLRESRNYIHPGLACQDSPWIEAELRDFQDAEAIYSAVFWKTFRQRSPEPRT